MAQYYVYFTKDQAELEDVGTKSVLGGRFAKINDPFGRNIFAINGSVNNANANLQRGLKKDKAIERADALQEFVKGFRNRMNASRITSAMFFIHFGSQNIEASRELTARMREAARGIADLKGCGFLAVSRHHSHPAGFFKDGKFTLPEDGVIERALQEKGTGDIGQPYPHFRALVILCQALLAIPAEEERKKVIAGETWENDFRWKIVDGKCRDFTDLEQTVLDKKGRLRELLLRTTESADGVLEEFLGVKDVSEKALRELLNICTEEMGK